MNKENIAPASGLGWMGFLAWASATTRLEGRIRRRDVESANRPLPDGLDVKRTFHLYDHPGEGLAFVCSGSFRARSGIGGRGRSGPRRRAMYGERYGIEAYADAQEMLDEEQLDIVCDEHGGAVRADGRRGRRWGAGRVGR